MSAGMSALPPESENEPAGYTRADLRERYLSNETVPARQLILSSWQRSTEWRVNSDELEVPYNNDIDTYGTLTQGAAAVMEGLQKQIADQSVALVLTDAHGVILDRRVGEPDLRDCLDNVRLAPGFTYSEQFVGTNGIGTALEAGQAAQIYDQEHFTGPLTNLTCAGVPIYDPVTGSLEGVIDLTCFARDANPFLMTMATAAAQSIQTALLHQHQGHEISLLNEYLRITRRCQDPVLAVSENVLMLNEAAHNSLSSKDQAQLVEQLREDATRRKSAPADIELTDGRRCRMHAKHVNDKGFAVIARIRHQRAPAGTSTVELPGRPLPGIAGTSASWQRCSRDVRVQCRNKQWTLLQGEFGTGKSTLAQAVYRDQHPGRGLHVIDLRDRTREAWWELQNKIFDGSGGILLHHLDLLTHYEAREMQQLLHAASTSRNPIWIAATSGAENEPSPILREVLAYFTRPVEVPPLRHHIEDIEAIASLMLRQITKRASASFTSAALHVLMRNTWPGNIHELHEVIKAIANTFGGEVVTINDLPPQCFSQNKRILTRLESLERDTIVKSLTETGGNRSKAARAIGISRATIYRKINEYGIDIPPN